MGVDTATLTVKVVTLGSDDEEVADSAERLRRELLTFDTDSLQPVEPGQAPDGSKGVVAVGRATAGQQEDLVRAFLDRHAAAGP